jgi:hypothetical protein
MPAGTEVRDHIRAGEHRCGERCDGRPVGSDVGALVEGEGPLQRFDPAVGLADEGAKPVPLRAGVVRRQEVLLAVFDPLDGPTEPHRGEGDEHVFRIELASWPEPTADVGLTDDDALGRESDHRRDRVAVPERNLGGTVDHELLGRLVVVRLQAPAFQRHPAVPSDGHVDGNDGVPR